MGLPSMSNQRASAELKTPPNGAGSMSVGAMAGLLSEEQFRRMLCRERKRSERSRKSLLPMLIDSKGMKQRKGDIALMGKIARILNDTIRETDLAGWFEAGSVLGVIFTELGVTDVSAAVKIIESKVTVGLQKAFKPAQLSNFQLSFYAFPDAWEGNGTGRPVDAALYPDLFEVEKKKKLSLLIKRVMDFGGSAAALLVLSPAFLALAALIKLTSEGPIFFRPQRVGPFGLPFVFLQFRSMDVSTDATIHKEFVRKFIAGQAADSRAGANEKVIYKITNDPRVTWIGRIMRRTSLDEIPQFWNVLVGEMSLVGPRPPIPYEIEAYDIWHRRRLLESKPGITGLWP